MLIFAFRLGEQFDEGKNANKERNIFHLYIVHKAVDIFGFNQRKFRVFFLLLLTFPFSSLPRKQLPNRFFNNKNGTQWLSSSFYVYYAAFALLNSLTYPVHRKTETKKQHLNDTHA